MKNEIVIEKSDRFVTIKKYCEMSGLSYQTVSHLCDSGQLNFITTEGGLRRIDTKETNPDNKIILEKLEEQEKILKALARQFNTAVQ